MAERYIRKSRFLSWVLRHAPEGIGLELDSEGWAGISDLIRCAANHGVVLTEAILHEIVATDQKGRYVLSDDERRIRASYGHSLDVDLGLPPKKPPSRLYHGTATRFLDSVMSRGLKPGRRRFVHLSSSPSTAVAVGRRHGKPITLEIDAEAMHQAGFLFYEGGRETWLVAEVPVHFLRLPGSSVSGPKA
jgi:putative RNA 2'-phosphotransferase